MPWTAEQAREFASRGGKAKAERARARRALSDEERARHLFETAAPEMAKVLIEAAKGEGDFGGRWERGPDGDSIYIPGLDPKERAAFAKTVLEFGIGRPRPSKAKETEEAPADDHGLELA